MKNDVRTDVTWNKLGRLTTKAAKALPSASARYMIDKVPIVGWLPRYNPRWLINDTIAGLTLGLMLIPQGLSYASLATIPIQYGLMSSWFPSALYAFMGTTKGEQTASRRASALLKKGNFAHNIRPRSVYRPDLPHRAPHIGHHYILRRGFTILASADRFRGCHINGCIWHDPGFPEARLLVGIHLHPHHHRVHLCCGHHNPAEPDGLSARL